MREIKFRCWDKENKEMLDVEYLHWDDCTGEFSIRTTMYSDYFDTEDMILMQYIGLKDENGKEIYENMIINKKYIVVYEFGKFILKDIQNGDITDFERNGVYEITGEYLE